MKFKSVVLASALVVSGVSATAATIIQQAPQGPSFSNLSIGTITVSGLSNLVGNFFAASDIAFTVPVPFTLTLDAVTFTSSSVGSLAGDLDPTIAGFSFANVPAGSYVVKASGTLDGSGQFKNFALIGANYNLSPVPEPETYVLMLAGLGAVGFVAARRRPRV